MEAASTGGIVTAWLFAHVPRVARPIGNVLCRRGATFDASARKRIEGALAAAGVDSDVAAKIMRLPVAFMLDVMELRYGDLDLLERRRVRISGVSLDDVKACHRLGAVVLGCSNFGCFYHALLACRGVFDDVLVVIGGPVPPGEQKLREKIEAISGARIRLVRADRHSGITIARQLAGGGVVATMLDTYLPTTDLLVAPFLGRPAASPAGIYRLASRYGATTIPVFCLRRKGHTEIEIGPLIPGAGLDPAWIAGSVNRRVGEKILEEPQQWMMWHTLQDRWRHGQLAEPASSRLV